MTTTTHPRGVAIRDGLDTDHPGTTEAVAVLRLLLEHLEQHAQAWVGYAGQCRAQGMDLEVRIYKGHARQIRDVIEAAKEQAGGVL